MAVINDRDGWIFVHIPKSGGHAFYAYYGQHKHEDDIIEVDDGSQAWGPNVEMHAPASALKRWMATTSRFWLDYRSFAILRDPIDRMQSMFWEIQRSKDRRLEFWWDRAPLWWWDRFDGIKDVNDFVQSDLMDGPQPMLRSQCWYVTDDAGGVIVSDFFFRETMAVEVPRYLGLPGQIDVFHQRPMEDDVPLTQESIDRIRLLYADDFELIESIKGGDL